MAEVFGAERDAISSLIEQLAEAFLSGDQRGIDELLEPGITMFDSVRTSLVAGIVQLDAVRHLRDAYPGHERDVQISTQELRVWEVPGTSRTRLVSYLQQIRIKHVENGRNRLELTRNTALVYSSVAGILRFVHLHEDVVA